MHFTQTFSRGGGGKSIFSSPRDGAKRGGGGVMTEKNGRGERSVSILPGDKKIFLSWQQN